MITHNFSRGFWRNYHITTSIHTILKYKIIKWCREEDFLSKFDSKFVTLSIPRTKLPQDANISLSILLIIRCNQFYSSLDNNFFHINCHWLRTTKSHIRSLIESLQGQLGSTVTQLLRSVDAQLPEGWLDLLQQPRVNGGLLVAALVLASLQPPDGQSEVVNATARLQTGRNDLGLRHQVHAQQIVHALAHLPSVDARLAEKLHVAFVEGRPMDVRLSGVAVANGAHRSGSAHATRLGNAGRAHRRQNGSGDNTQHFELLRLEEAKHDRIYYITLVSFIQHRRLCLCCLSTCVCMHGMMFEFDN